jgi:diaminobutyrate-2-oxoglutarate transaminase
MTQATEVFERLETECRMYCRDLPVVFDRAAGSMVVSESGEEYLDFFSGGGALNYGHNEPTMANAAIDYLQSGRLLHALDLHTTAKRDLLTAFDQILFQPNHWDYKVQFTGPTGTDANEAALKLARLVTGRRRIVSFNGSYHGMSIGSLSVSGNKRLRGAGGPLLAETTFVPYENGPYGPFDSIDYLVRLAEDAINGQELPAAVIVEPVQIQAGVYPASAQWLQALRDWTREHGVLLIMDEIQTGCGRTGRFFAFEKAGIVPDLVTCAKSISGSGLPMACVLISREHDAWRPGHHTGTFRGNQLAFVTAKLALELWTHQPFLDLVKANSDALADAVAGFASERVVVGCRGEGMLAGIDFALGNTKIAKDFQQLALRQGVIVERCGPNGEVAKLMPPVNTPTDQLVSGLSRLRDALHSMKS